MNLGWGWIVLLIVILPPVGIVLAIIKAVKG